MYRAIITPKETKLIIELPKELVGRPVEILAFEIEKIGEATVKPQELTETKPKRTFDDAVKFWDAMAVDMSNFTFNREEANER
jgi:hypothetical protein